MNVRRPNGHGSMTWRSRLERLMTVGGLWWATVAVGLGGLAVTAIIAAADPLRFASVSAATRVSLETAQALIAAMVARLAYGRFRRRRGTTDLLLVIAFGISAMANLLHVGIRAANEAQTSLSPFGTWSGLTIRLVAAATFAVASLSRARTSTARPVSGWGLLTTMGAVVALVVVAAAALVDHLPESVRQLSSPVGGSPDLENNAAILAVQVAITSLLLVAAAGFSRRPRPEPGQRLLGPGLALAAVATVDFMIYPSHYTDVIHVGDAARLGFYLLLLVGADQELRSYWRDRAQMAVLDERRRLARELHDGLTQELTFIRSRLGAADLGPDGNLRTLSAAADEALAESRRTVMALADSEIGDLDSVIRSTVSQVCDRVGLEVTFELAPGITVDDATAAGIGRIAREAATNVVRHASARQVVVGLRADADRIRLTVTDDGVGIDPPTVVPGFGLRSMEERADEFGGRVEIVAGREGGTSLRLTVPTVPPPKPRQHGRTP